MDLIELPISIQELQGQQMIDRREYQYWKDRENRLFYIDYEIIDDYDLLELSKTIISINIEDNLIPVDKRKPIVIFIHSYGGDTSQAMYMSDIMISSKTPIITVAMGVAMSSGFLIFLAGSKRYAFPHTKMLAHKGYATISGTAEEVEAAQKNYKIELEEQKKYILGRTSIDKKVFDKNQNKDWYLSGDDLINYKIVDEVITDLSVIVDR